MVFKLVALPCLRDSQLARPAFVLSRIAGVQMDICFFQPFERGPNRCV